VWPRIGNARAMPNAFPGEAHLSRPQARGVTSVPEPIGPFLGSKLFLSRRGTDLSARNGKKARAARNPRTKIIASKAVGERRRIGHGKPRKQYRQLTGAGAPVLDMVRLAFAPNDQS
jgi:hypothetical protein